jgi:hypothetical protein
MSLLDFDNAQRSWYMVDLGTLTFEATYRFFLQIQKEGEMSAEVRKAYSD